MIRICVGNKRDFFADYEYTNYSEYSETQEEVYRLDERQTIVWCRVEVGGYLDKNWFHKLLIAVPTTSADDIGEALSTGEKHQLRMNAVHLTLSFIYEEAMLWTAEHTVKKSGLDGADAGKALHKVLVDVAKKGEKAGFFRALFRKKAIK